jgi:hypothetical protein
MADTSLWPVVVGGLLTGLFALGGIGVGLVGTARRDAAQERRETRKRREEKFQELVAAVYEYDHWTDQTRWRAIFDEDIPQTVSPFAKIQSISAVYFPQFGRLVDELNAYASQYVSWIYTTAAAKKGSKGYAEASDGFNEAYMPYMNSREALLDALKKFAREEFQ